MSKNINCFVIMPITVPDSYIKDGTYENENHFRQVYDHIIKPAIVENGWNPIYPQFKGSRIIIAEIIKQLTESEMVVCDISIYNPNVFFEAGIRTAVNRPITYIKDDQIRKIPFDTSGIGHETYHRSLRANYLADEVKTIAQHMKVTYDTSQNANIAWQKYGLTLTAETPTIGDNPLEAKIDLLSEDMKILKDNFRRSTTGTSRMDSVLYLPEKERMVRIMMEIDDALTRQERNHRSFSMVQNTLTLHYPHDSNVFETKGIFLLKLAKEYGINLVFHQKEPPKEDG